MSKKPDHKGNVKQWLLEGKKITSAMAFTKWKCTRLSSVINRLKKEIRIEKEMKKTKYGVRYASYYHTL